MTKTLQERKAEAWEAKRGAWVALAKALKTKGVSGDEEWDTYEKTWEAYEKTLEAYQSICREIEEEGK